MSNKEETHTVENVDYVGPANESNNSNKKTAAVGVAGINDNANEQLSKLIQLSYKSIEKIKQFDNFLKLTTEKIFIENIQNVETLHQMLDGLIDNIRIEIKSFNEKIEGNDTFSDIVKRIQISIENNDQLTNDEYKFYENFNKINDEYANNVTKAISLLEHSTRKIEELNERQMNEKNERIENVKRILSSLIILNKQLKPLIEFSKATTKNTKDNEALLHQLNSIVDQFNKILNENENLLTNEKNSKLIELSHKLIDDHVNVDEDIRLIEELNSFNKILNEDLKEIKDQIEKLSNVVINEKLKSSEIEETNKKNLNDFINLINRSNDKLRPILRMMNDVIEENNDENKKFDLKELNDKLRPLISQSLSLYESSLAEYRQLDPKKDIENLSLRNLASGQNTLDDIRFKESFNELHESKNIIENCKSFLKLHQRKQQALDLEKEETEKKLEWLISELSDIIEQGWSRLKPICDMIDNSINAANEIPDEEMDEQKQTALVDKVIPLIEQAQNILNDTLGQVNGFDRHSQILKQCKDKVDNKSATEEEKRLAEKLSELAEIVNKTIENAKSKLSNLPQAKRDLLPLLNLLSNPITQILGAVGLLLTGVLNLVGKILSGLGLGGIVDGVLRGLRIDKILYSVTGIKIGDTLKL